MKKMIEITLRKYNATEIEHGFISAENIELVTNGLMLKDLTDEELSEMWKAVHDYFQEIYAILNTDGNVVGWKPYTKEIEHARDTSSAWLEVINKEARTRRWSKK